MIDTLVVQINDLLSSRYNSIKLEEPKDRSMGDLAIPLFTLSKALKCKLPELFELMKTELLNSELSNKIEAVEFNRGYLNIFFNRVQIAEGVVTYLNRLIEGEVMTEGKGQTVVFDYSSPNIAKTFSVGHLRSTIIGNALANIYKKLGYNTVRINHLGDWGTQFGKMIVAYQKWGKKERIEENPIAELSKLYVRFHKEVEEEPSLEDEAREAFARLERLEEPHISLWKWFKEESLKEFEMMYERLNVTFDHYTGESFYNDQLTLTVELLHQQGLLVKDEGAMIIRLEEEDLPPALIQKSDGSSLYLTRDLAAFLYRKKTYHFNKAIYVVGNEQSLHFKQLRSVVRRLGHNEKIDHVNFGLVLQNGKKMSTRQGRVIKLGDVLDEAVQVAKDTLIKKGSTVTSLDEVAEAIGVGAIIYNDLKNERTNDIEFTLEQMVNFDGVTGPYLQYTRVRIHSIRSNSTKRIEKFKAEHLDLAIYYDLLYLLGQYKTQLLKAQKNNEPSVIAKYAYYLAKEFNRVYGVDRIIVEDEEILQSKLSVLGCCGFVLDQCLEILGIKSLSKM